MGDMCSIEMAVMFLGGGDFHAVSNLWGFSKRLKQRCPSFDSWSPSPLSIAGSFRIWRSPSAPSAWRRRVPSWRPKLLPKPTYVLLCPRGAFVSLFSQLYLFGAPLQLHCLSFLLQVSPTLSCTCFAIISQRNSYVGRVICRRKRPRQPLPRARPPRRTWWVRDSWPRPGRCLLYAASCRRPWRWRAPSCGAVPPPRRRTPWPPCTAPPRGAPPAGWPRPRELGDGNGRLQT